MDTFERAIDTASASHELVRRKRRDWLEAQYRAGLVAGGEVLDHDWVEWFVDRVRSWPSDVAVRVTLQAAADVGFGSDLKHFPVKLPHCIREPGPVSVSKAPTPYTPSPASPGR